MSYGATKDHIAEIYQLEVSEATISSITDQLIPQLKDDADKVITTLTKAYASVNEVRAAAGLQPIKGNEYDKPIMPMNVTTELDAELDVNKPIE